MNTESKISASKAIALCGAGLVLFFLQSGLAVKAEDAPSKSAAADSSKAAEPEPDAAFQYNNKGIQAYKDGRYSEAEDFFNKSSQELLKMPDQKYILHKVLDNLSLALQKQGKTKESDDARQQSRKIIEAMLGPEAAAKLKQPEVEAIPPSAQVRDMMQQLIVALKQAADGKTKSINIQMPPDSQQQGNDGRKPAANSATKSAAQQLNEQGINAFREHSYTEALILFTKAVEEAKKSPEQQGLLSSIFTNVSICYEAMGNNEMALNAKQQAIAAGARPSDIVFSSKDSAEKNNSGSSTSNPNIEKNWTQIFDKGRQLKQSGNYTEAEKVLELCSSAADKFPPSDMRRALSYNALAGVYLHTNKPGLAEDLYKRTLPIIEKATGTDSIPLANTLDNIAETLTAQKKMSEAEAIHRKAIKIYEKFPGKGDHDLAVCLGNLGYLESQLGRKAEAKTDYLRSMEILKRIGDEHSPQYGIMLDSLGSICYETHQYAQAANYASQALPLLKQGYGPKHPEVAVCLSNLATTYVLQNKLAQAAPLYKEALEIEESAFGKFSTQVVHTAQLYGQVLRKLHKDAEAANVEKLAQGRKLVPGIPSALLSDKEIDSSESPSIGYMVRGLAQIQKRSFDKSLADINKALSLDPKLSPAYGARALVETEMKDYDAALKDLNKAIEMDPSSAAAYRNRGHVHCILKQYQEALTDLDRAIKLDPKFLTAYAYRGETQLGLGDNEKAVSDLSSYLSEQPGDPLVLNMRGQAYEKLGKRDLADADYAAAKRLGH